MIKTNSLELESFGWPPVWQEYKDPNINYVGPYESELPDVVVEIVEFVRFELVLREPLMARYFKEDSEIRRQYEVMVSVSLGEKTSKYVALKNLVNHPSTSLNERENAKCRIKEIVSSAKSVVDEGFPEIAERARIDRVRLFYENLDVMLEGRCGEPSNVFSFFGKKVEYFAYAKDDCELGMVLKAVQNLTDNYMKVPKRLCSDGVYYGVYVR